MADLPPTDGTGATGTAHEGEYVVVVNVEEQYSIWRTAEPTPAGWTRLATTGTRDECLDHIEQVWTDMRPLSLRRVLDGTGSAQ
ncbi:MbtH family protein [Micromonospora sp. URMC 107]|uniref:MbtH family protein n=1 Tax=Micromonospora sp. URMC 107 TaxID=3423418 RepID=UPI003F19A499